jgi:hypothetical protein
MSFDSEQKLNRSRIIIYLEQSLRKIVRAKDGRLNPLDGAIESWQSSVDSKPVIIRRAIKNITFFIQSDKIPEL